MFTTSYTKEQIKQMIELSNAGKQPKEIGQIMGLKASKISDRLFLVRSYMQGRPENPAHKIPQIIKDAVDEMRSGTTENHVETNHVTENISTNSVEENLKFFEKLFSDFQIGLVQFIKTQSELQAEEKVKSKEQEIAQLKIKYEAELARMQKILVAAQDSSAVGMIKRMWNKS